MTMNFESVRVLVTGGAGFIGSHLVEALVARKARVRVLDNFCTGRRENLSDCLDQIELLEGDILDADACRRACEGVEVVFHEAALGSVPRSLKDPATSLAVNIQGTVQVMVAAKSAGAKRVVYASSSSVYGDSTVMPKREGQEGRPLSPYALSKRVDEEVADTFARCYGMELIGLRYFNVYGPRQDPSGPYAAVVPRFFQACVQGVAPTIYGDGTQSRDFTFVQDVVEANLLAAAAPTAACGRAYNVGAGNSVSVNDLATLICEITGAKVSPRYEPARSGDVPFSLASTEDVRAALGFQAKFSISEGLRRTAPR
jgi:nucleoside-diphosphate-sugar epimerase